MGERGMFSTHDIFDFISNSPMLSNLAKQPKPIPKKMSDYALYQQQKMALYRVQYCFLPDELLKVRIKCEWQKEHGNGKKPRAKFFTTGAPAKKTTVKNQAERNGRVPSKESIREESPPRSPPSSPFRISDSFLLRTRSPSPEPLFCSTPIPSQSDEMATQVYYKSPIKKIVKTKKSVEKKRVTFEDEIEQRGKEKVEEEKQEEGKEEEKIEEREGTGGEKEEMEEDKEEEGMEEKEGMEEEGEMKEETEEERTGRDSEKEQMEDEREEEGEKDEMEDNCMEDNEKDEIEENYMEEETEEEEMEEEVNQEEMEEEKEREVPVRVDSVEKKKFKMSISPCILMVHRRPPPRFSICTPVLMAHRKVSNNISESDQQENSQREANSVQRTSGSRQSRSRSASTGRKSSIERPAGDQLPPTSRDRTRDQRSTNRRPVHSSPRRERSSSRRQEGSNPTDRNPTDRSGGDTRRSTTHSRPNGGERRHPANGGDKETPKSSQQRTPDVVKKVVPVSSRELFTNNPRYKKTCSEGQSSGHFSSHRTPVLRPRSIPSPEI